MKTTIFALCLFSIVSCQNSNSQSSDNAWPWNALICIDQVQIPVYNKAKKDVVSYFIMNDTIKEEYFLIQILSKNRNLVKVKTASAFEESKISEGWMELKYLGIYTNSKNKEGSVPLYLKPDIQSDNTKLITNKIVKILDIKDDWYKVVSFSKHSKFIGWIKKKDQCANPYSTCN